LTAKVIVKIEPSSVFHQINIHGSENVHYCCECTKTYATEDQVIDHFENFHPECVQNEVKLATATKDSDQCSLCQEIVICMRRHRRRKHHKQVKYEPKEGEFACKWENCDRIFKSQFDVNNCEQRHKSERIQCPNCPQTFSRKGEWALMWPILEFTTGSTGYHFFIILMIYA
jgi:hypothetical protein